MDNDRALLEAAARAAGVQIVGPVEKYIVQPNAEHIGGFIVRNDKGGDSAWNPLRDDGDALRLAVERNMQVDIARETGSVHATNGKGGALEQCALDGDWGAATRRAIVRAVAEDAE